MLQSKSSQSNCSPFGGSLNRVVACYYNIGRSDVKVLYIGYCRIAKKVTILSMFTIKRAGSNHEMQSYQHIAINDPLFDSGHAALG
jgi:hypothetical protein